MKAVGNAVNCRIHYVCEKEPGYKARRSRIGHGIVLAVNLKDGFFRKSANLKKKKQFDEIIGEIMSSHHTFWL